MLDPKTGNEAYFRGFQDKCAEYGVDPSTLYVAHVTQVVSPEVRTAVVKVAMTKIAQSQGELLGNSLVDTAKDYGTGIKNWWNQSALGGAVNMGAKAVKSTIGGLDTAGRFLGDVYSGVGDAMAGKTQLPRTEATVKPKPAAPAPAAAEPAKEPVVSQPAAPTPIAKGNQTIPAAGQPPATPAPIPAATTPAAQNSIKLPPALSLGGAPAAGAAPTDTAGVRASGAQAVKPSIVQTAKANNQSVLPVSPGKVQTVNNDQGLINGQPAGQFVRQQQQAWQNRNAANTPVPAVGKASTTPGALKQI